MFKVTTGGEYISTLKAFPPKVISQWEEGRSEGKQEVIDTNWGKVPGFQVLLLYASISYMFVFTGYWSQLQAKCFL